ncbi:MAG: hydantoinase [Ilumatobacteraceae bacterium]|nr:hydantoinase [Ilumatobacteraceae bacterium]
MTSVRVGVDVGGTFTKAVAVELSTRAIVASSVVPTTHNAAGGVAAGVVEAVAKLAAEVGAEHIELVTHSTTQAVNALLEGDAAEVGVIGMGRRPDLARVEKRVRLRNVELAPGKQLRARLAFFDVTDGLPAAAITKALQGFIEAGVAAVCIAEAFSPDDDSNETAVAELARGVGLPACTSTELSGLYGLELRTVTAALNASILPIAVSTASFVADGVRAAGITAPVMVMRSDGGATDLAGFSAAPVRTLYSGPSASVAGALRYTGVTDAIVIEVGGTSTNIAAIRNGRPALSYVRVASHATALRSVDVRVVGVAGGSMLRVRRGRVYGIGPRSAHIAGLQYACFTSTETLRDATVEIGPAMTGDPDDYVILRTASGERCALTTTCAANLLGVVEPGDYCAGDVDAATVAFELLARQMKVDARTIAEHMLDAAGAAACELALIVARSAKLEAPSIVGVGGGAGALARRTAAMLGWPLVIPEHAEVISSIGDALSLLRAERERTAATADAALIESMMADVEAEVVAAGASPATVEVRFEEVPERSTVRAVATGAVGLLAGALPGRHELDDDAIRALTPPGAEIEAQGRFWIVTNGRRIDVLDRYGDQVIDVEGERAGDTTLADVFEKSIRYRGPVTLRPTVWIIDGRRLIELASIDPASNPFQGRHDVTYLVGRQR